MDETRKKKVSLGIVIFVIVIIFLVGISVLMFKFYNKKEKSGILDNNNTVTDANNDSTGLSKQGDTTNSDKQKFSDLNINDELVDKVYEYIPIVDTNLIQKNAYQDKKITKSDLDVKFLLQVAFSKLNLSETQKSTITENGDNMLGMYSFNSQLLQDKVREMYGDNLENLDFNHGAGASLTYSNGKYSYRFGGGSGEFMYNLRTIKSAYKDDEYLYIEDIYSALELKDDMAVMYKNSNSEEKIKEIEFNRISTLSGQQLKSELEKIKTESESLMARYKHTFKKNIDGNYYWYCTEPII